MKQIALILLFCLIILPLKAQFEDDFSDGNLQDPEWFGNVDRFAVVDEELQLQDASSGESFLYVPVSLKDSVFWEFYFRIQLAPSNSNRLKVYLTSDAPDLTGDLNGYFIQVGKNGAEDNLELRRQDGSSSTILLSGAAGAAADSPVVRVRVIRDASGNWEMLADYTGGMDFQSEGTVFDDTYSEGSFFGFFCDYANNGSDKFFFDDVFIAPLFVDVEPPELLSAEATDANTVLLHFNEPLHAASAENAGNYSLDNGVAVNNAVLDTDPTKVLLGVSALTSGSTYTLSADNIADEAGNIAGKLNASFTFFLIEQAEPYDILINEILADPDDQVGSLPNAEFVELFNRSSKAIQLEGFEFSDASSTKILPDYIFSPNRHLIICDESDVAAYSAFGEVLGTDGFPGLNNSGDDLSLRSASGDLIHEVLYQTEWYRDKEKDDGGWTLELVNPNLFCIGGDNWRASNDPRGGTPGEENSVLDDTPDLESPKLFDAVPIAENQLRLIFDEVLDENAAQPEHYEITGGTGDIQFAELEFPDRNTVLLTLSAPFFTHEQTYTVLAGPNVTDCTGNAVSSDANSFTFTYYKTEPAERYDILINEIMANPFLEGGGTIGLPGQEYIELYNRSDKAINLENFLLMDRLGEILLPFYILLPGEHLILYEIAPGLDFSPFGNALALDGLVSFGNEGDDLELISPEGEIIHAVYYRLFWYRSSSKDDGGWSLELINPGQPCLLDENWRASDDPLGGTPGKINSILDTEFGDQGPELARAFPIGDNAVRLFFNKALDEETATKAENYEIDNLTISNISPDPPFFNSVVVFFTENFVPGTIYRISVGQNYQDCVGNPVGRVNSVRFALPDSIEPSSIIINEVLFDPEVGGVDFVELYNRSDKVFNVGELLLANRDERDSIDRVEPVSIDFLIFPGDYVVLTPAPADIQVRYDCRHLEPLIECDFNPFAMLTNSLPTYPDKEGTVVVYLPSPDGAVIIDEVYYEDDYHYELIDDPDGVSLERIDPEGITQDPNNWHSGAQLFGFATPTYRNSQFFASPPDGEDIFTLSSETISPDGDGFEDFLLLDYEVDQAGYTANIDIFDVRGRLVKKLVRNELLAEGGFFQWDGATDNGEKARIGVYVIWIELFNPSGEVEHFKLPFVVAARLE